MTTDKFAQAREQAADDAAAMLDRPGLRNLIRLAGQQTDDSVADLADWAADEPRHGEAC